MSRTTAFLIITTKNVNNHITEKQILTLAQDKYEALRIIYDCDPDGRIDKMFEVDARGKTREYIVGFNGCLTLEPVMECKNGCI